MQVAQVLGKLAPFLDANAMQNYVKPTLEKLGADSDADVIFYAKEAYESLALAARWLTNTAPPPPQITDCVCFLFCSVPVVSSRHRFSHAPLPHFPIFYLGRATHVLFFPLISCHQPMLFPLRITITTNNNTCYNLNERSASRKSCAFRTFLLLDFRRDTFFPIPSRVRRFLFPLLSVNLGFFTSSGVSSSRCCCLVLFVLELFYPVERSTTISLPLSPPGCWCWLERCWEDMMQSFDFCPLFRSSPSCPWVFSRLVAFCQDKR